MRRILFVDDEPRVLDVGGTTADARWVALDRWRSLTWTVNWREALEQLHHAAHEECFIANSVKTEVTVETREG